MKWKWSTLTRGQFVMSFVISLLLTVILFLILHFTIASAPIRAIFITSMAIVIFYQISPRITLKLTRGNYRQIILEFVSPEKYQKREKQLSKILKRQQK